MKKKYYSPICDRVFSEEELLNVNSNWTTNTNNPEDENGGTPGGTVDNDGKDIEDNDVGAKVSPVWDF